MIVEINNNYFKINILLIILLQFLFYNNVNKEPNNSTNIPELLYYNNQTLQLLIPPKNCPSTLFFSLENQKYNNSINIKTINLKDKNYFITFFECDHVYDQHLPLLEKHGLIQSHYKYGKHNLFLCPKLKNPSSYSTENEYDLNKYQKVFVYLNMHYLFQKNTLYTHYLTMKQLFLNDFNYMPETYNYPKDKNIIENKFKNYQLNMKELWFVKPSNRWGGDGVRIFISLKKIKFKEFVVTKYITNIHLINEKKYDLRLYALITGIRPLRIYFYNEGFVRIASEKYSLNLSSINNKYVHLTNIGVNKLNKNFKLPNTNKDETANVWNIQMYKNYLKKYNIEWNDLKEKIKDIIIKSIISVYQNLLEEIKIKKVNEQSFYNLLGYDILKISTF